MSLIVGAGLAGLIAAHAWPQWRILEAAPEPRAGHSALLRFRTDSVAKLTGTEFRRVRVQKGIWMGGRFVPPTIRAANLYSAKVLSAGRIADRSIWNIEPVDRWVAPENLYDQLVDAVRGRVAFGAAFDWEWHSLTRKFPHVVSTAPMELPAGKLLPEAARAGVVFERAPIHVERFRVPRADVYQTVYFPAPEHSVYRASITRDLLIVEHAGEAPRGDWWPEVEAAFALPGVERVGSAVQRFGKIAPIEESARRKILFDLTHRHGIYSLGRFATWRNILLDDVVNDIAVIKRLIRLEDSSGYALRLEGA